MPWKELKPMDLKVMFIADYLSQKHSLSQLCRDYEVSRKTGYKWIRHKMGTKMGTDLFSSRRGAA